MTDEEFAEQLEYYNSEEETEVDLSGDWVTDVPMPDDPPVDFTDEDYPFNNETDPFGYDTCEEKWLDEKYG
jgi:hypothetical protein